MAIQEINERMLRTKNVMVFGLSESKRGTVEDKILDDKAKFQSIVTAIDPGIIANDFKLFLIGKASGIAPSMLSSNVSTVCKITKAAIKDLLSGLGDGFPGVSIGRDRTRNEATHLEQLRAKLAHRSESGEDHLTIKYINGIPKIVQSKNE